MVDCYHPVAPELFNLVNGLKQVFAFGFSYGVIPWITVSGYKDAFATMAGINCGIMLLGVPLYLYGKRIRQETARWKVITW